MCFDGAFGEMGLSFCSSVFFFLKGGRMCIFFRSLLILIVVCLFVCLFVFGLTTFIHTYIDPYIHTYVYAYISQLFAIDSLCRIIFTLGQ